MVGDEWFEYVDEPEGGRFDGENNNFGLVNVEDQPYQPLVDQMAVMHSIAPDRLVQTGPTCDSWADGTTGVTCTATMPRDQLPAQHRTTSPWPGSTRAPVLPRLVAIGGGPATRSPSGQARFPRD